MRCSFVLVRVCGPFLGLLLLRSPTGASGFDLPSSVSSVSVSVSSALASPAFVNNMSPISAYLGALATYPLPTKMVTGATLAVAGDAIAQAHQGPEHAYDQRRAASFAVFDMCYRALQHAAFPAIVAHCHGQYMASLASLIFAQYYLPLDFAAALERTLCSQLGIVPFLYYPVFYAVTAYAQQLTVDQAVDRARQTFVPLMERNLMFWIPVQFIQFSLIPEDLQIPFVCVCGLAWTFVLSVMAGAASTKAAAAQDDETTAQEQPQEVYCVLGTEDECFITEDHLLPDNITLQDFSEELSHEMEEVAQFISHEAEEVAEFISHEAEEVAQFISHEAEEVAQFISHEVEEITHIVFDDDQDQDGGGDPIEKKETDLTEKKETEKAKEEVYK